MFLVYWTRNQLPLTKLPNFSLRLYNNIKNLIFKLPRRIGIYVKNINQETEIVYKNQENASHN